MITDQQRIARWMGWTQDTDRPEYWYTADDSEHEGEPRRLPDLGAKAGVAEWCALIEVEILRRGWRILSRQRLGHADVQVFAHGVCIAMIDGATKLAALTEAMLDLMESEK